VTVQMIPKYCYYRPASETRSDKFIIERHPKLVAEGKRQWSTSEAKKKFKKYIRYVNYFLGFIYLVYSIYMIRLVFCKKEFILISRYSYMYIYFVTGITLISSLYYYWRNELIDQV